MRTRAYRPEVPRCLENRSLLSGVAGLSAHPVVLSRRRFNNVAEQMRVSFQVFGRRDPVVADLRSDLLKLALIIPFGRVDGLGVSINRIVDTMQQDLTAKVPHAVRTARNEVIAATRAEVEARVRAGDVVVR